jgi:hypothetical protein
MLETLIQRASMLLGARSIGLDCVLIGCESPSSSSQSLSYFQLRQFVPLFATTI